MPGKNLMSFGTGKTLISLAIDGALAVAKGEDIIVSSDDPRVLEVAERHNVVALRRPAILASDWTSMADVVRHALRSFPQYDAVCVLQPTSPFRRPDDILVCLHAVEEGLDSAFTVTEAEGKGFRVVPGGSDGVEQVARCGVLNGAVFAFRKHVLQEHIVGHGLIGRKARPVPMPRWRGIDIDTREDLLMALALQGKA